MVTPSRPRTATPPSAPLSHYGAPNPAVPAPPPIAAPAAPGLTVARLGRVVTWLWERGTQTLKGQFIALGALLATLALLQAFSSSNALAQAHSDLDTISNGSIPSVDAAQAMAQYSEDLDAKAADYLATAALTSLLPCTVVGTAQDPGRLTTHDCDARNLDAEIILFNRELYNAAHNVTYAGERTAIERITAGFEEYTAGLAVMRHEWEQAASKTDPADPHLQAARIAYEAAGRVLHQRITRPPTTDAAGRAVFNEPRIPDCTPDDGSGRSLRGADWPLGSTSDNIACLSSINKTHLDTAYRDTSNFLGGALALAALIGGVLALALGFTTWRMSWTTHRFINLGLTLSLLVGVLLSGAVAAGFAQLGGRHGTFGELVQDDYASIYDAAILQRIGTTANADESRWIIAQAFGDTTAADRWAQDWQAATAQVATYINHAQANRTWVEEDAPLQSMRQNWERYYALDARLRATALDTANPDRIRQAEALSTGDSNNAFADFLRSVDELSTANRRHYTATTSAVVSSLSGSQFFSSILFPLVGVAAAWGISLRLKDF